ncbi:MAG TPA: NAD-dependent deacylase [Bacillota bacterium]|nr:NAD-dependent deacylase [Bacillota bacterium]
MNIQTELTLIADAWRTSKSVMVLTGAGISTESGLPDFRSATGMWTKNPTNLFTMEMLDEDPKGFYAFYHTWISNIWATQPNLGHKGLAALMKVGFIKTLATQNIDGLHQEAGSANVLELHGTLRTVSCMQCAATFDSRKMILNPAEIWLCPKCKGHLRPDITMFGESLPENAWEKAGREALRADLFVVVGSSLTVSPANLLPEWAVSRGAKLLIINHDPTPLDERADWVIRESAGEVIGKLAELVDIQVEGYPSVQ